MKLCLFGYVCLFMKLCLFGYVCLFMKLCLFGYVCLFMKLCLFEEEVEVACKFFEGVHKRHSDVVLNLVRIFFLHLKIVFFSAVLGCPDRGLQADDESIFHTDKNTPNQADPNVHKQTNKNTQTHAKAYWFHRISKDKALHGCHGDVTKHELVCHDNRWQGDALDCSGGADDLVFK